MATNIYDLQSISIKQEIETSENELLYEVCNIKFESEGDLCNCLQKHLDDIKSDGDDESREPETDDEISDFKPPVADIKTENVEFDQPEEQVPDSNLLKTPIKKEPEDTSTSLQKNDKIQNVLPKKIFDCDECNRSYSSLQTLKEHLRTSKVHNKVKKEYICDTCGKIFEHRKGIREHLKFHLNGHFKCEICGVNFMIKSSLRRHLRIKHAHVYQYYYCHHCNREFKYKRSLKVHLNAHRMINIYTCPECFRQLNSLGELQHHKRNYHSVELTYKCKVCSQSYFTYSQLVWHRKKHLINQITAKPERKKSTKQSKNEENRRCSKALDKSSAVLHDFVDTVRIIKEETSSTVLLSNSNMNRVPVIKEEEYVCDKCSYISKNKDSLKKHQQQNHTKLKFDCARCNKHFTVKSDLAKHNREAHSLSHKFRLAFKKR